MPSDLIYVAAACNRFSQAADVSPSSSLVAFGSSSLLALWDLDVRTICSHYFIDLTLTQNTNDKGVSETLPEVKGLITCVKFLANDILISANDAGVLSCWRMNPSDSQAGKARFLQEEGAN